MQISRLDDRRGSISIPENQQEILNNENNRAIFGERLSIIEKDDISTEILSLRLNSSEVKIHETDNFTETWEGNDSGLIWGKKEARDKSWKEEWIEQRNIPRQVSDTQISLPDSEDEHLDTNNVKLNKCEHTDKCNTENHKGSEKSISDKTASLGQLIGVDYKTNRRWKEKWFRKGNKLFVRKCVQQLCENNLRVLSTWYEDSEFSYEANSDSNGSHWRLVVINKYGRKEQDQKEWREQREFNEDFQTVIYQERSINKEMEKYLYRTRKRISNKDRSESIYSTYFRGSTEKESELDNTEDLSESFSYSLKNNHTLQNESKISDELKHDDNVESWSECIEIDSDGNKHGKKRGIRNNVHWSEVWFENIDGSKEYDKWFKNNRRKWGEKNGYSTESNQNYTVKWQEDNEFGDSCSSRYIEKSWEKVGDNDSWGESQLEQIEQAPTEMQNCKKIKKKKKHWYNNGTEIYMEIYNEISKYEFEDGSDDVLIAEVNRNGEKRGERMATCETWSEDWNELLKRQNHHKQLIRIELNTNKQWTKGNRKWGENKSIKLKGPEEVINTKNNLEENEEEPHFGKASLYVEKTERWHKSESEEFTDRWETEGVSCKGYKKGIDKKQEGRSIEWEEEWDKSGEGDLNKNCCWIVNDEKGLVEIWTEEETQKNKGKTNITKKGVKFNSDDRNEVIEKWSEIFNDDGNGNSHTSKQGKSKDSWYSDEFGKSSHTGEQWAIKQGYDKKGSWTERWTEKGGRKEAWKRGENCYGDKWEEEWKEDHENKWKWAQKSGQNGLGDNWVEEWREEIDTTNHISRKCASKKGRRAMTGEEWSEEWGESYFGIGNEFMGQGGVPAEYFEKWTNRYAIDGKGNCWGSSWGDTWNWESKVNSWGENWVNGHIKEKW